jgi:hypothetical protein
MRTARRTFPLVFITGATASMMAVGISLTTTGTFFSSHRFLAALRGFGLGYMIAGCGIWITACRECAGKRELNPLLDLSLAIGSMLLLGNLIVFRSNVSHAIALTGLIINASALVIGVSVMLFAPAYPCPLATDWPEGGDCRDPHVPATELRHPQGHAVLPEDLTVISGIGPRIEEILNEAGIVSYLDVADHTPQHLEDILEEYHFTAPFDTRTWPEQAQRAASGEHTATQNSHRHPDRAIISPN